MNYDYKTLRRLSSSWRQGTHPIHPGLLAGDLLHDHQVLLVHQLQLPLVGGTVGVVLLVPALVQLVN